MHTVYSLKPQGHCLYRALGSLSATNLSLYAKCLSFGTIYILVVSLYIVSVSDSVHLHA